MARRPAGPRPPAPAAAVGQALARQRAEPLLRRRPVAGAHLDVAQQKLRRLIVRQLTGKLHRFRPAGSARRPGRPAAAAPDWPDRPPAPAEYQVARGTGRPGPSRTGRPGRRRTTRPPGSDSAARRDARGRRIGRRAGGQHVRAEQKARRRREIIICPVYSAVCVPVMHVRKARLHPCYIPPG